MEIPMRTVIIGALVGAASTLVAAPQQTTSRPGEMTKSEVWVQNRGRNEAIAVDLREVNTEGPLRVQVINGESPAYAVPLPVHVSRQAWEYKTIVVSTREDPAVALHAEGDAGWETTGIAFVHGHDAPLLLKRQR